MMEDAKAKQTIEYLLLKKEGLLKDIRKIEEVIELLMPQHEPIQEEKVNSTLSGASKSNIQEVTQNIASFDDRIIQRFKTINKFVRITDFAIQLSQGTNRSPESIISIVRRLKKSGKVASVRFNGNFGLTFWGLPAWISNNKILKENYPVDSNLTGDDTYEIDIRENKKGQLELA